MTVQLDHRERTGRVTVRVEGRVIVENGEFQPDDRSLAFQWEGHDYVIRIARAAFPRRYNLIVDEDPRRRKSPMLSVQHRLIDFTFTFLVAGILAGYFIVTSAQPIPAQLELHDLSGKIAKKTAIQHHRTTWVYLVLDSAGAISLSEDLHSRRGSITALLAGWGGGLSWSDGNSGQISGALGARGERDRQRSFKSRIQPGNSASIAARDLRLRSNFARHRTR